MIIDCIDPGAFIKVSTQQDSRGEPPITLKREGEVAGCTVAIMRVHDPTRILLQADAPHSISIEAVMQLRGAAVPWVSHATALRVGTVACLLVKG